jgi:acetyl-CoA/propionyl-CoA carboxylase biotin carboxyl carrier protein
MRRVERPADVVAAAEGARREAGGAFGNTALYLERMIEGARHVEVQIVCDDHDAVAVLGERDCSMQRRHQKVLEECPAPGLADAVRAALHAAGANAARALGYRGAGTVELLLRGDEFWFLEMNRRLQVEHPVTELCFGVDLVAWQLAVAAGERLPAVPEGPLGHAIEARVYAEDPAAGFLPSPGEIVHASEPQGPGIRVDSALVSPMSVSSFYDPLLAKVIAHGATREEAVLRLRRALAETVVMGVRTNVGFLRRVLDDGVFAPEALRVDALDTRAEVLASGTPETELAVLAAVADRLLPGGRDAARRGAGGAAALPTPWDTLSGFRLGERP